MIILLVATLSCTNQQSAEQENETAPDKENLVATVSSNGGTKWKGDEATKKNVAAMMRVVNDTAYVNAAKKTLLYTNIHAKIDTLVKECSMKGAGHEALHMWRQIVLKDLKELQEEDNEYSEAYAALKKDVGSFYQAFE